MIVRMEFSPGRSVLLVLSEFEEGGVPTRRDGKDVMFED